MSGNRFIRTESNVFFLEGLPVPKTTVSPEVTHHVLVVDRSGSMWGDIEKLKQSIEQALAVGSFTDESVLTTLISFSSHGDVTLHWSKVPVGAVTDLSKPYLDMLRGIKATYLTGISQALDLALESVDASQTTGITLFTDGYANHPSAYSENKAMDAFVERAKAFPGLFFNAIGYRDWCDWPRMNAMTNALSGKTVKARSFKDVLGAMKDTQELLSGSICPALVMDAPGDGQGLLAVNRTTGQVNFTFGDLSLRGVSADDTVDLYKVAKAPATDSIPRGTKAATKEESYLFGALAIGYASASDVRSAKGLLFSSGNKTLWEEHMGAITPSSLSAMVEDLQAWVMAGTNEGFDMGRNVRPKYDLFDLAEILNGLPARSVGLSEKPFYAAYRRRSIQKVPGKREADGTITPPSTDFVRTGRVYVKGMSFNNSDASAQLDTAAAAELRDAATGEAIKEIEFVDLGQLQEHRSYTLVSAGERNVEILPLEVYTQEAWDALTPFILPSEARDFKAGKVARIRLKRFKMESEEAPTPDEVFASIGRRLHAASAVKAYSAMQNKGASSPYTAGQVAALKERNLTPSLNYSSPTTVHYTDKEVAATKGEIDSYTRYKVHFGTTGVLSTKALKSGNAFLQRRYKVATSAGVAIAKPKLTTYLAGDTYEVKPLSPRAKETEADKMMNGVFDHILLADERIDNTEITRRLEAAGKIVTQVNDLLQPLVMEVGCTGLLPLDLEASMTRYEPEDFTTQFGVKLGKAEAEGVYYVADNGLVISIVPETSWYTVEQPAA